MESSIQDAEKIWYFAYGSNMASATRKRRQLNPFDSRTVEIPSHVLCFDIFGVPYKEPAMAGIRDRSPVDDAKATPPAHGIAYLLSRTEYHQLIVSEGAGVAYIEVELMARSCAERSADRSAACVEMEMPVWTLKARFPFRPEALPSVRYMTLLIQGAEESGLPIPYQKYLLDLPAYHKELSVPKTEDTIGKLETLLKTLQQIDTIHLLIEKNPDDFGTVRNSDDIIGIFNSGRIASLIGVEGLHQIAESASAVRLFHKLGVRYITLCHDHDNIYVDSSSGKRTNGGLSSHGLDMVREMNRVGMWVAASGPGKSVINMLQDGRLISHERGSPETGFEDIASTRHFFTLFM
ncbi:hypothetical protein ACHAPJ_011207 [Fusarium lateritium]